MNKLKIIGLCLLLINILSTTIHAQVDREFWFAIPKETNGHGTPNLTAVNNVSFKITAMSIDANVTVSMPANPSFTPHTFVVPSGKTYIDTLATNWAEFEAIFNNNAGNGLPPVSGKLTVPKGILITSDVDITVYYDFDNFYNRDLFSLKGKNALGYDFYVPFQTIWKNGENAYNPDPYATIEIVATTNNTVIEVTPTKKMQGYAFPGTIPITLNRGETFSLRAEGYNGADHPSGTRVRVVSGGKISVISNDDSVFGAEDDCYDILGDQLVPTDIIGSEYVVMTGKEQNNYNQNSIPAKMHESKRGEQIFVVATQDNTDISFYDKDGNFIYKTGPLAKGETDYLSVNIGDPMSTPSSVSLKFSSIYVTSNNNQPFYVFHTTGIGCELGGAIVPPITNCTGSSEVNFYRSNSVDDITVNLMVQYDSTKLFTDSISQSHYYFTLTTYDAAGNVSKTFHIPGSWFEKNRKAGWAVLKFDNRDFAAITTKGMAHKVSNTMDFFHLGMTNGTGGQTNKYGYFSSFNVTKANAHVYKYDEDYGEACFGAPLTLIAGGGLSYTWHYGTEDGEPKYLDNGSIKTPTVLGAPVGDHIYFVKVQQSKCFGPKTIPITVKILPLVTPDFDASKYDVCAPDTLTFINKSVNADMYMWKKNGSDMAFSPPETDMEFKQTMDNGGSALIKIDYTLYAYSVDGCGGSITKTVTIRPQIEAYFDAPDTVGCHPLSTQFTNQSAGNLDKYYWNFGDQGSSQEESPLHIYKNFGKNDTTYHVRLVTISPFLCSDTATTTVRVHPFIEAHYATDTVRGCSPLYLQIQNGSLGAISRYEWNYGTTPPDISNRSDAFYTYKYDNIGTVNDTVELKLSVFNAAGCESTMSRFITIYPEIQTSFSPNLFDGCNPLTVNFTNTSNPAANSFYWDFDDGSNTMDKSPVHIFENLTPADVTYHVKLRATTNELCPGEATRDITVRGFISANFSLDTSKTCTPVYITVHNESIGGPTTQYRWNFGDGSAIDLSPGPDVTHKYYNYGVLPLPLTISLEVEGTGGCIQTITRPITLYPEIDAAFSPSTDRGCNALTVNFTNSSTTGVAENFTWTFGDGTSSNEAGPTHVFSHLENTDQNYTVKLVTRSKYNCVDSVDQIITVFPYIDARFTIDKSEGCSPLLVTITDASAGGIVNKIWTTEGQSSAGIKTSHEYINKTNSVRDKELRLLVKDSHGCEDIFIDSVKVYPEVIADFKPNVTEGCNPLTIRYANLSRPNRVPERYRWELGDGATYDLHTPPDHIFKNDSSAEKTFTTRLYAYSEFNCQDTQDIKITVYPLVKASFSNNNPLGCSPHIATFTNGMNIWPGANGYTWIYDNGVTEKNNNLTVVQPYTHFEYSTPRTFRPKLVADYNGQCQDTMELTIVVYPEVHALFTQDTLFACHYAPEAEIQFTNESTNAQRYYWYFGDKGTAVGSSIPPYVAINPPLHTYYNFGDVDSFYRVKLVASSIYNCTSELTKIVTIHPKPKARFNVANSVVCPPFALSIENQSNIGDYFLWTFGDGGNYANTIREPITHTYDNATSGIATYNLNLFVQTMYNCTDEASQSISVYPHVIADFEPDIAGCSPLLVDFTNNTVRGEKFDWNFADGTTSKMRDPDHRFFNPSINDTTFKVQLIAQSEYDCLDTTTRNITVYPQPEARFNALPSHLYFPDAITNIANETNPGNWTFSWDFDDGQTSTIKDPIFHEFADWGNYNIKLTAQSINCIDSVSQRVRVFPPMPIPDFEISNDKGCVPLTVNFINKSTWAKTYYWEFDDGGTSTMEHERHTYTSPGKYQVKLTVTGDGGVASIYRDVVIHPKPEVLFDAAPRLVMLPNADVNYYNKSKLGARFLWDFGDGAQSSEAEPKHRYEQTGTYTIALTVWTEYNCTDSSKLENIIKVLGPRDIRFPNAFTPNTNGPTDGSYRETDTSNDIFHPFTSGVGEYHLEIYNRWGEKIFETDDINIGWDGYYKGELCKADVYIFKAKGKFLDGTPFEKVGDVTLLR